MFLLYRQVHLFVCFLDLFNHITATRPPIRVFPGFIQSYYGDKSTYSCVSWLHSVILRRHVHLLVCILASFSHITATSQPTRVLPGFIQSYYSDKSTYSCVLWLYSVILRRQDHLLVCFLTSFSHITATRPPTRVFPGFIQSDYGDTSTYSCASWIYSVILRRQFHLLVCFVTPSVFHKIDFLKPGIPHVAWILFTLLIYHHIWKF